MNTKVYLFASFLVPFVALIFIVIGLSIDIYTGHFNLATEFNEGGVSFLLLGYLLLGYHLTLMPK